jgi:hypothetical protein
MKFLNVATLGLSACYALWALTPLLSRSLPNWAIMGVVIAWFICASLSVPNLGAIRVPRLLITIVCYVLLLSVYFLSATTRVAVGNFEMNVIYYFPICIYLFLAHKSRLRQLEYFVYFCVGVATLTSLSNVMILHQDPLASKYFTGGLPGAVIQYQNTNLGSVPWVMSTTVLIPVIFGLRSRVKSRFARAVFFASALLNGAFVVYAASSTSTWILAILVGGLLLWGLRRKPWLAFVYIVLAVIGLMTVSLSADDWGRSLGSWGVYSARLTEISQYIADPLKGQGSLPARMDDMAISFNSFLASPILGVGMMYGLDPTAIGIGQHSQVVDDLGRYGLVGGGLLGAIYLQLARTTLAPVPAGGRSYCVLGLGGALLLSLFNPTVSASFGLVLFLLIPGCGLLQSQSRNEEPG